MKAQRLRFRYRVTSEGCALAQRQLIEAWEKAVEEAGLALAYSEGKRRTAQISVAAPLPQSVTSDGEMAEVFLSERVEPQKALQALKGRLPPGVDAFAVEEIGVQAPSLQSQLRWAEYEVLVEGWDERKLLDAVEGLLAANTLPSEYRRETRVRRYDLRPLVLSLRVEESRGDRVVLVMRLRAEPDSTGRADQVVLALGIPEGAARIHRRRLQVDEVQPAVLAYRRAGQEE